MVSSPTEENAESARPHCGQTEPFPGARNLRSLWGTVIRCHAFATSSSPCPSAQDSVLRRGSLGGSVAVGRLSPSAGHPGMTPIWFVEHCDVPKSQAGPVRSLTSPHPPFRWPWHVAKPGTSIYCSEKWGNEVAAPPQRAWREQSEDVIGHCLVPGSVQQMSAGVIIISSSIYILIANKLIYSFIFCFFFPVNYCIFQGTNNPPKRNFND